jgi:ABC-type multidrug transport system ATPase subunit
MALDRVRVAGVGKRYGHQRALAGVDLELRASSLTALLGPNGAGKTSLLGILSTLIRPTTGTVEYLDGARVRVPDDALRRDIGVLAHASLCYGELTGVENLRFFADLYDVGPDRVAQLLDQVGLDRKARERPARTYSRGMLQRLALARALLAAPSLLLLDEPFTGLDRGGIAALAASLATAKLAGTMVLVVTHDLEAIGGLADHVAVLRRGQLAHEERRPEAIGTSVGGYSYGELRELYERHTDEAPRERRAG